MPKKDSENKLVCKYTRYYSDQIFNVQVIADAECEGKWSQAARKLLNLGIECYVKKHGMSMDG